MEYPEEYLFILKPSSLGGIGVFAATDIPKNTRLFSGSYSSKKMKIKDIPPAFLKYCVYINNEEVACPEHFDRMEIGWYLNHSDQPNSGKHPEKGRIALRDIQADEEILIDYNSLEEPLNMRESYYYRPPS